MSDKMDLKKIAEKFGVSVHTVKSIQQNANWEHV